MQQLRQELARSTPHEAVHRQRMGIFDLDLLFDIFWKSSGIFIINSEKGQTVTSHIYGNSTWHDLIIKMILNVQFTNCFLIKRFTHPVQSHGLLIFMLINLLIYFTKRGFFFDKMGKAVELQ